LYAENCAVQILAAETIGRELTEQVKEVIRPMKYISKKAELDGFVKYPDRC
jgi:hypothetical protein